MICDTRTGLASTLLVATSLTGPLALAQSPAPDTVFTNGKIVTVDGMFTTAEAVAVTGNRITAVGTTNEIEALANRDTRTVDLDGRTVIPGLIDNHMHLLRAGTTWPDDVRLDGVASRAEALQRLRARAAELPAGAWVFTLGGFMLDQFADDSSPFTRDELDRALPEHPVLLQAGYYKTYLNSLALAEFGIDDAGRGEPWVVRDSAGRATGEIEEPGVRPLAARLPVPSSDAVASNTRAMIADLNRMGLTTVASAGCPEDLLALYRSWAARDELNLRVFCMDSARASAPDEVDAALAQIPELDLFWGDNWVDRVLYGEGVYNPLHDRMHIVEASPTEDELYQWRRLATAIAEASLPLQVHAHHPVTISAFLDIIEDINRQTPIRALRWTFAHGNQLNADALARMKALGMYVALHPWTVINGAVHHELYGDAAYDFLPMRTIEDSGITWGLGSDGSRANQIEPLRTLGWAVTGDMVGGRHVTRQTISREEALIAHTRDNAHLIFREDELGSIEPGKLADFVVLDRDYLTVPADEIKDLRPIMTVIDGRIVFEAQR
jgi:predicted amidohydrolase YtcJ